MFKTNIVLIIDFISQLDWAQDVQTTSKISFLGEFVKVFLEADFRGSKIFCVIVQWWIHILIHLSDPQNEQHQEWMLLESVTDFGGWWVHVNSWITTNVPLMVSEVVHVLSTWHDNNSMYFQLHFSVNLKLLFKKLGY